MTSQSEAQRSTQQAVIGDAMKERGWSQADLARAAELPRYTISRIVRGETLTSEAVAQKVEKALDLKEGSLARAAKGPTRQAIADGIHFRRLPNGDEHVQLSLILDQGSRIALEAIAQRERPISFARLANILKAITEPGDEVEVRRQPEDPPQLGAEPPSG